MLGTFPAGQASRHNDESEELKKIKTARTMEELDAII
jgi:hypothetical protein